MIEKNAFTIIFGIFFLFTCHDVFYGQGSGQHASQAEPKHLSSNEHSFNTDPNSLGAYVGDLQSTSHIIPTVKIQYCHSCGYRQAFDEISRMLSTQYPELKLIGEYHQPGWIRSQIVNLLFIVKWAVVGMLYMDVNPFSYFNIATPEIWMSMTRNKLSTTLLIVFFGNTIDSNMMSTGAFEIFYNDMPVWSKLQTGRMPSGPELMQIVQAHMSLGQKSRIGEYVPT